MDIVEIRPKGQRTAKARTPVVIKETIVEKKPRKRMSKTNRFIKNIGRLETVTNGKVKLGNRGEKYGELETLLQRRELIPKTAAGRAYLHMVLNPCTENYQQAFTGIPDSNGAQSALFSCRDEIVMDITTVPSGSHWTPPTTSWEAVVIGTNQLVLSHLLIMAAKIPTIDTIQSVLNSKNNGSVSNKTPLYPTFVAASTKISTSTGLVTNYTGPQFAYCWFRPANMTDFDIDDITFGTGSFDAPVAGYDDLKTWRIVSKGYTSELDASSLTNQGRILASHTPAEVSSKNVLWGKTTTPPVVAGSVIATYVVQLPSIDTDELAALDVNFFQGEAKDGCYTVHRRIGEANAANLQDTKQYLFTNTSTIEALTGPVDVASGNSGYIDLPDMNFGFTIQRWTNLDVKASIRVKSRMWYEFTSSARSPYSGFMKPGTMDDPPAMNLEKKLATTVPHNLPACYNDMGILGDLLNGVVGMLPFGNVIKEGIGLVTNLLGSKPQQAQPVNPAPAPFPMANPMQFMQGVPMQFMQNLMNQFGGNGFRVQ